MTFFVSKGNCVLDYGHTTYQSGDSFLSSDCSSKCTCHPGGNIFCIPLCKPLINDCKVNEQAIQVQENVYNSTCTCPALKCVTNPSTQGSNFYSYIFMYIFELVLVCKTAKSAQ